MRSYDDALRRLKDAITQVDLKYARQRSASGIGVGDAGGFFGSPGTLTAEEIFALIGAGLAPGAFLTVIGGGKGTVNALGTLGATPVVDLALGNYHWGTLDQEATVTLTGWTNGKDCQIVVELIEDGTGGWDATFSGVTWIGGSAPTPVTTAGTVTHYAFFSRDGGTTIYGAQLGSGGSGGLASITDGVTTVAPVTSATVPLGGVVDNTGGDAGLRFVTPNYGGQEFVNTVASSGSTETLDLADGNVHDLTLSADCAVTTDGWQTGVSSSMTIVVRPAGFALSFTDTIDWLGGSTPTFDSGLDQYVIVLWSFDGGTTIGGTLVGSGTAITGAELASHGVVGPIVMTPGITNPPEPVWTPAGDDYVYAPLT